LMSGATAHDPTTKQKMSIILYSGTVDKLTAAAILAAGGAAMDMQVNVFLTFWALLAMKKGAWQDTAPLKVSAEFAEYAPMMEELADLLTLVKLMKDALTDDMVVGLVRRAEGLAGAGYTSSSSNSRTFLSSTRGGRS